MKPVCIFLFSKSTTIAEPWIEAGYECWLVDVQHPIAYDSGGITIEREGSVVKVHADLTRPWYPPLSVAQRVVFFGAFPPCDHLAVSGARWFKGKGLRKLAVSVQMFATAAELADWLEVPGFIENPVSTIASYWRKPDYTFHPHFFTGYNLDDNYTKLTCLWAVGGLVVPEKFIADGLADPDDRIHKCPPSADRTDIRSATPAGFSRALFEANHPYTEGVAA